MEIVISLIILFVGIAILVVIHVCIVGRVFRGNNTDEEEGTTQGQNMSGMKRMLGEDNIGDLKNLPCFVYEEAATASAERRECSSLVDCAVCLESFKVGDVCRLLPNCNHTFHLHCIDSWILHTPICPICRTWVLSVREHQSDASENVEIVTS
ncbi:RING-H2 finger protein ATL39-like [Vigna unguiculata]|uniref:RING-type E3 ubiquitin transferase n=1 Tax=Vigna unguiculata TaxID=3917 RepID=A0A4D6LDR9_VIGUN|nr:RING-H2 finger protein ATL39-like [Vigna unguiculata]QCD86631.1 E3 ubiquitin-protein ligase [Vigna unguiculata]QCD86632.1 E3 ubiquitin-protein ligase [Vigna unguiculata]QCD86633.1 E3 ubiquitin-protein ligase [Vigna unguiculata]